MPSKHQRGKEKTPDIEKMNRIADVFSRHYYAKGLRKTAMDAVATDLHMSKRTIYELFKSKQELLDFTQTRLADKYSKRMTRQIETYPQTLEKVKKTVRKSMVTWSKCALAGDHQPNFKQELMKQAFLSAVSQVMSHYIRAMLALHKSTNNEEVVGLSVAVLKNALLSSQEVENPNWDAVTTRFIISLIDPHHT